jgi:acyl-CoA reductase-like NAD-dependent aldehyde dehydrogenase
MPAHVCSPAENGAAHNSPPRCWPRSYETFEEAIAAVNDSRYGLQAAVFTRDWNRTMQAFREIEAGAVLMNESTLWRREHMPYGGVKESGVGREGIRSAIESMTEEKMLVARF